jgi:hypothetical protein
MTGGNPDPKRPGPWPSYDDGEVCAAVGLLLAFGVRDGAKGGVAPEHLAVVLDNSQSNLSDRLARLADRGRLVRVDGVRRPAEPLDSDAWACSPRQSFLPTAHPDAPGASPETGDGPPRTLREVEQ